MKNTIHILAVEDDGIIYKDIKDALKAENFSVDGYTPSVADAIARINKRRPDLVLLDIDLQGEQTGIDLGTLLMSEYKIPFIYVTDHGDNKTYFEALKTQHQDFIEKEYHKDINAPLVVETKPELELKKIIRAIYNMLSRNETEEPKLIIKDAILGFVDYINNTKDKSNSDVSKAPVKFTDIAFFTTNTAKIDEVKTEERGKQCFVKLKPNYTRFETWENKSYYLPISLSKLYGSLPNFFIQTSEDFIVNIIEEMLDGTVNGSRLKIRDTVYIISKNYKAEVKKRLETLYLNVK